MDHFCSLKTNWWCLKPYLSSHTLNYLNTLNQHLTEPHLEILQLLIFIILQLQDVSYQLYLLAFQMIS